MIDSYIQWLSLKQQEYEDKEQDTFYLLETKINNAIRIAKEVEEKSTKWVYKK